MYTYTISAPSQPSVPPTTHQHPYPSLQPTQYLYNLHLTHLNPTSPSPFLCLLSCPIPSSPSLHKLPHLPPWKATTLQMDIALSLLQNFTTHSLATLPPLQLHSYASNASSVLDMNKAFKRVREEKEREGRRATRILFEQSRAEEGKEK